MPSVSTRPLSVNARGCDVSRMRIEEAREIAARDGCAIDRGDKLSIDQYIDLAQAWQVVRAELTEAELLEYLAGLRNTCASSL